MLSEFGITLADGAVWLSIGQGLLFGAVCLLFGVWIARFVGLLSADAPAGETLGVGLAAGLLVLASWWAAIASGGRSSFTPVAVGFALAIGLAAVRRWRPTGDADATRRPMHPPTCPDAASGSARRRNLAVPSSAARSSSSPSRSSTARPWVQSPRDGVQPLEMMDQAYYSILGRELAKTGTETIYSPAGFDRIQGLPDQTWYHWGEAWLAAAAITIFGTAPLDARHFIVLPLLVLATATMTGTLVRRLTGATSSGAFIFGFVACLFLAPVPLIAGPHFSSWAVGMIFGITLYGLAAVAVLFAMYGLAVLGGRQPTWALAAFAGSAVADDRAGPRVIAVLAASASGASGRSASDGRSS